MVVQAGDFDCCRGGVGVSFFDMFGSVEGGLLCGSWGKYGSAEANLERRSRTVRMLYLLMRDCRSSGDELSGFSC